MLSHFRLAMRSLLKSPGFSVVAVLTLGLCLAANVVIFTVVDTILLRPLPFPDADRLATVFNSYPGEGVERSSASIANYFERRDAIKAFASTSIYRPDQASVGAAGSPRVVDRTRISPEFFATLGVPLALGRTFTDDEMLPAGSHVAILTDAFWRDEFNADPRVLGLNFRVDSESTTVIGVLPPGFRFLSSKAQFFTPIASALEERSAGSRHHNGYQMIARLAPNATIAIAQAQIDNFNASQLENDPTANVLKAAGYRTTAASLHADHVREIQPLLLLLLSGALLLLLIGVANLVNLLLIRASSQAKEFAIRQALGARRWHVARAVVLETTLLVCSGGLLGLTLGALGIRLLGVFGTNQLPLGASVAMDSRIVIVTVLSSFAIVVLLSLPILWYSLRSWLAPALQADTRSSTVSRAAQRMRHGFIVAQLALAFVLLSGAGLLGLSLQRALNITSGFQPEDLLTAQFALPLKKYADPNARLAFTERLIDGLRAHHGVGDVAITSNLPMAGSSTSRSTVVEGRESAPGESHRAHNVSAVSSNYFRTLGIPLRHGRALEDADNHREQKACVVDEEFARRYWPGQSALGRRLTLDDALNEENAHTIVGVVGTIKQKNLTEPTALGSIYFPYKSFPRDRIAVVVRSSLGSVGLASVLKEVVLKLDPELPINQLKLMQTWIDDGLVSRRSPALLAVIFAGTALLLAALGTYGVLAYAINQRWREIGVRMALGALPRQILRQFLGLSVKLLLAGLSIGLVGAWFAGQAMQNVLFGVSAFQASILLGTAALMIIVVFLATLLPSRRASRIDPLVALRAE